VGKQGRFQITGTKRVMERLDYYSKRCPEAVIAGLMELGERVAADAVERTPVDSGRLRSTAYVAPPEMGGRGRSVEVGFGTDYAVHVHENTSARHAVGEAKFLEKAVLAVAKGSLWRIAKTAAKFVESRGPLQRTIFPERPPK